MAFCSNCGHQLADGAKFCFECGAKVNVPAVSQGEQRKTVYDGKIHKCPNCGDILDAYEAVCESCGYERRGNDATSSSLIFAEQLNAAPTEQEKAAIIQSFPIPNSKEDIIEFLILASSSINRSTPTITLNAWKTKIEQCYLKAKLVFIGDQRLAVIEEQYLKSQKDISKAKRRLPTWAKVVLPFAICAAAFLIFFVGITMIPVLISIPSNASDEAKVTAENDRLNAIVQEVYDAIEEENYTLARAKAVTLSYAAPTSYDREAAIAKWDRVREDLLEIIDRAEQGQEYTTDLIIPKG